MRRWIYIFQEAATGLVRNLWMTVAVVLSVTVSLALFGASVLLRQQIETATDDWAGKIEVSVFLCDGTTCPAITPDQEDSLRTDLQGNPLVEEVFYETKEEAYENFLDYWSDNETMVDNIAEGDLPASFRLKLVDPADSDAIQEQYEALPYIDQINNQQEIIEPFLRLAGTIRWAALGIAAIQMLAATVLVANTVRVAAVARRDQTQIMKLVGASNWYVRLPFVLEGTLAGLLGALLAWSLLAVSVPTLLDTLQGSLQFVPFLTDAQVYGVWPWLVVPAVGITSLSSTVALWGFLDV